MRAKSVWFGFFALLLLSFSFADAAGAEAAKMKMAALDGKVKPLLSSGQAATYDNFFGKDGKEYAIASLSGIPSYMLTLAKQNGNYSAEFITDTAKITEVYNARLAAFGNLNAVFAPLSEITSLLVKFNSSRSLPEKRCAILLGAQNGSCTGSESCAAACNSSPLCSEFYAKDKSIPSAMAEYFAAIGKLNDADVQAANLSIELSKNGASAALVGKFNATVFAMKSASDSITSSKVVGASSVCAPPTYDMASLNEAESKLATMQSAAAAMGNVQTALGTILAATEKAFPKKVEMPKEEKAANASEAKQVAEPENNFENLTAPNENISATTKNQTAQQTPTEQAAKPNDDLPIRIIAGAIIAAIAYFAYTKFGKRQHVRKGL